MVAECLHLDPFDWAFAIDLFVVVDNGPFDPVALVDHKLAVAAWDTFLAELDLFVVVGSSSFVPELAEPCQVLEPFAFVVVVEHKPLVVEASFVELVTADLFVAVAYDSSWTLVGSYS